MRKLLASIVLAECALLVAAAVAWGFGLRREARLPPAGAVFRPPIYDGVMGESVRYETLDAATGEALGYLEYTIVRATEYQGTLFGREFVIRVTEHRKGQGERSSLLVVRPRAADHGWLPPIYDEEARGAVPGAQPVVRSIATTTVEVRKRARPGFLVETVVPRNSLTEVAERFWLCDRVPVFGVVRWEAGDVIQVLLRMEGEVP